MNPNPDNFSEKDALLANPDTQNEGTEGMDNPENPTPEAEPVIDYKMKFSESAKESLRLLEENKKILEENKRLQKLAEERELGTKPSVMDDSLYPGFEDLDEGEKERLINYTNSVKRMALQDINKDPAIAYTRRMYNEKQFDSALASVVQKFPDLRDNIDDFKAKNFNPDNVPKNIEEILESVAKIHLFDKAKDLGAIEEKERANRLDTERARGGDRTPTTSRSAEDWQRMQRTNPAKFAKMSKEFKADLESGKLEE